MQTQPAPAVREIPAMHTWAEENGQPPFNWSEFLARTDQTDGEWLHAAALASDWVTCACGNSCAAIPRWSFGDNQPFPGAGKRAGEPKDAVLSDLGMQFYRNVYNRAIDGAVATLAAIELRSAELLREMEASQ